MDLITRRNRRKELSHGSGGWTRGAKNCCFYMPFNTTVSCVLMLALKIKFFPVQLINSRIILGYCKFLISLCVILSARNTRNTAPSSAGWEYTKHAHTPSNIYQVPPGTMCLSHIHPHPLLCMHMTHKDEQSFLLCHTNIDNFSLFLILLLKYFKNMIFF